MKSPATKWIVTGIAAVALAVSACASGGSGSASAQDQDVITFEELQGDPGVELLSVVQHLRPRWLRGRGTSTLSGSSTPTVIVDGQIQEGGIGVLRTIRASDIQELRFMSARDATTRYGPGMISGAILVTRRR